MYACLVVWRVLVQLVASTDHLRTWVDLYSLVDHFTIVPTFVGIYYDRNWIGQYNITSSHLLLPIALMRQVMQSPLSVCTSVRLFPLYLRNGLTVDLELSHMNRS